MDAICTRCKTAGQWSAEWRGFLCPTCADKPGSFDQVAWFAQQQQLRLTVPTYNASYFKKEVSAGQMEEFGEPKVRVLIHESLGIRIILGTHDFNDRDMPDIQIERQPNGWAIFLHPLGGSDPSGLVFFLDDGRSYLQKDYAGGPTPAIQVLEAGDELEEIDGRGGS